MYKKHLKRLWYGFLQVNYDRNLRQSKFLRTFLFLKPIY
nr:MAG TPA: hypothetical protein [Caudoviricetes sp.]